MGYNLWKMQKRKPEGFLLLWISLLHFLLLSVFVKINQASCFYDLLFIFCHIGNV